MQKIIQNNRPVNQVHVGRLPAMVRKSWQEHQVRTPLKLARSVNGLPLNTTFFWVKTINFKLNESGRSIQLDAQQQPMFEIRWTYTRGVWRPGCTTVDLRYGKMEL